MRHFSVLQFPLWRRNGLRGIPSALGEPELVRDPASPWSLCPAFSRVKRKRLGWGGGKRGRNDHKEKKLNQTAAERKTYCSVVLFSVGFFCFFFPPPEVSLPAVCARITLPGNGNKIKPTKLLYKAQVFSERFNLCYTSPLPAEHGRAPPPYRSRLTPL